MTREACMSKTSLIHVANLMQQRLVTKTDIQTDKHRPIANTMLAQRHAGKQFVT